MKILFASAEVAPFSKAGGLSVVMGSLPKYIEKDAEIAIFTPLHGCIDKAKYGIKELENSEMWITFGCSPHKFKLHMTKLPDTNINVFFVQNDWYFSCFQEIYPKWLDPRYEHERYIAFSLATLRNTVSEILPSSLNLIRKYANLALLSVGSRQISIPKQSLS